MYNVEFSKTAEKEFYKLEKESQIRIASSLDRIKIRPYPYVKKLVGCPYFALRVGDYRIILDIREDKMIIFVIELGHRKRIYAKI